MGHGQRRAVTPGENCCDLDRKNQAPGGSCGAPRGRRHDNPAPYGSCGAGFPPEFGIWVEDNGQGAMAAPDRVSSASFVMEFFGTAQEWCDLQTTELTVWEIDNGNFRINS